MNKLIIMMTTFWLMLSVVNAAELRLSTGLARMPGLDKAANWNYSAGLALSHSRPDGIALAVSYRFSQDRVKSQYGHSLVEGDLYIQTNFHTVALSVTIQPLITFKISEYVLPYVGFGGGVIYEDVGFDPEFDPFSPELWAICAPMPTMTRDDGYEYFSHNRIGLH